MQCEGFAWPSQSPDLDIIEDLWFDLQRAVCARKPRNLQVLEDFGKEGYWVLTLQNAQTFVLAFFPIYVVLKNVEDENKTSMPTGESRVEIHIEQFENCCSKSPGTNFYSCIVLKEEDVELKEGTLVWEETLHKKCQNAFFL